MTYNLSVITAAILMNKPYSVCNETAEYLNTVLEGIRGSRVGWGGNGRRGF